MTIEIIGQDDTNGRLAQVYNKAYPQIIMVWPLLWKHEPYGNWFIKHEFLEKDLY